MRGVVEKVEFVLWRNMLIKKIVLVDEVVNGCVGGNEGIVLWGGVLWGGR